MTLVYRTWKYTGDQQVFTVPQNVFKIFFECWGAAGGMASPPVRQGALYTTLGGSAPSNRYYSNDPKNSAQLGTSYANNSGYASGWINVTPGDTFFITVGGNGGPGLSTIRASTNLGVPRTVGSFAGGRAGYNGGAIGGKGYFGTRNSISATAHTTVSGGSGGGGGGATDIRYGGNALSNRILVAAGSGGSGGTKSTVGIGVWKETPVSSNAAKPPFGKDVPLTLVGTGINRTWATWVRYLVSGWGVGGVGGASSWAPSPLPVSGGFATQGGTGGGGTKAQSWGVNPTTISALSGGSGGRPLSGGIAGKTPGQDVYTAAPVGYTAAANGALGLGGKGADGPGHDATQFSDWVCGGGGGAGGYYGGGGGGQGHYSASGAQYSKGGGGGGGSNFADTTVFTKTTLVGCARPPLGTMFQYGANGQGGFVRASYKIAPNATFEPSQTPTVVTSSRSFTVSISFNEPGASATLDHYQLGYGTSADTTPSLFIDTVFPLKTDDLSEYAQRTYTYPANIFTAGTAYKLFVRVWDAAGDVSAWTSSPVTAVAASTTTAPTIVTPATGGQVTPVPALIPVTWTNPATPLVAYVVEILDQYGTVLVSSGPQPGGSRINMARDPGFFLSAEWTPSAGATYVGADIAAPGASTKNGKVTWALRTDGSAQLTSGTYTFVPNTAYRLSLGLASSLVNDPKNLLVQVVSGAGDVIAGLLLDYTTTAALAYQTVNLVFTPYDTGTTITVTPVDTSGSPGNSIAGQITYLANYLLEPYTNNMATALPAWFGGAQLNGNTGTVAWAGTANASPSILTNTSATTYSIDYLGGPIYPASLQVTSMSAASAQIGLWSDTAISVLSLNNAVPQVPSVTLTVDSTNAVMRLDIAANDGAAATKTVYFDVFRTDVVTGIVSRVATYVTPDVTTRNAVYRDVPAHGQSVTYSVRAWSSSFGFADQNNGTVLVN